MQAPWKSVIVSPTDSADAALRILDKGGLRIALVVDESGRLVGVVTDGDIRRALLRHADFSQPVSTIMNPQPTAARVGTTRRALRSIMEKKSLLHIPMVDPSGKLVGLETFRDLLQSPRRDNWVFLMAGGFGTRLAPLTSDCPKPLLPVGGKPILETILESFIAAGFHRFYISVHYLAERIKTHFGDGSSWGVTLRYVEEETPLGTGGALGLLPDTDGMPVVMMNGDVLTRLDFNALLDFHEDQHAALTLCVREYDMQVPFGVVQWDESEVTEIVEKPLHRFFINAGVYVVSPEVIATTQPPRKLDMPDLVKQTISDKRKVAMFPIHEYWLDIGRPDDFERAQQEIIT
jgi:dTDP-glucose pyrophosphorylase